MREWSPEGDGNIEHDDDSDRSRGSRGERRMKSHWDDAEAARAAGDLALRCYSSRLLGREPTLVLHGGGNTSVKVRERSILGDDEDILYVKGSGWDLATIEPAGFAPVRLDHLKRLATLPALSDLEMVNELATHVTRASAPAPSVEAILHAILPPRWVDHTHADAVLTITNTADGNARIREIYDDLVVVVPYVMPGFDLARVCAHKFAADAKPSTIGMVLLNHGIFSFGATAKESYERMILLVNLAEEYLARKKAWAVEWGKPAAPERDVTLELAKLRKTVSAAAGFPVILARQTDAASLAFCRRPDLATIAQQGPVTPDHTIRTKNLPLVGRDVAAYVERYRDYFATHERGAKDRKTMLDPAPRVVLDPELGVVAIGRTPKDAAIVADIYAHSIEVIARATLLGGYRALPAKDLFDVEYWDLEQAKLKKGGKPAAFAGEVALVTGAASGIGRACVDALLARGSAVVGLDVDPAITMLQKRADYLGIVCDVTVDAEIRAALRRAVERYGGIDMLILNAGVFPGGKRVDALATDDWRRIMQVNVDANLVLLRDCHPLLKEAPRAGRVVVIGSKNVPAPGPGAAAYSASKAALTQLARVAALEWGADGIRINVLHPNAVFDTGIWTPEVLASRAAHYGMSVDDYKRNNVLRTEVASRDVAELAAEMCGPLFAKTTGAQVPVDGGNDRVI
jgi:rhamnose utilization protein RhaD (predicted bifunctional aldolase and dehydrogenase)/NAD(P)-dependent dehydrogenase (short-subunit alcohol dehydrogenase family)